MRRNLAQRYAQIETEARMLAWSGNYRTATAIERALVAKGYQEAAKLFTNRWTHSELERLCGEASRRKAKISA